MELTEEDFFKVPVAKVEWNFGVGTEDVHFGVRLQESFVNEVEEDLNKRWFWELLQGLNLSAVPPVVVVVLLNNGLKVEDARLFADFKGYNQHN